VPFSGSTVFFPPNGLCPVRGRRAALEIHYFAFVTSGARTVSETNWYRIPPVKSQP
jgi:hypothetical protein